MRVRNTASQYSDYQVIMELGMNIKGIDCCGMHVLFWNGKFAQIYEVHVVNGPDLLGNFECLSQVCALTQDSIITFTGNQMSVRAYSGEVKQVIPFAEQDGEVIKMDAKGKYMAIVTANNLIKMFDISRRQIRQVGITRKFEIKQGESLGEIKDISLNSDGKKLCILAD